MTTFSSLNIADVSGATARTSSDVSIKRAAETEVTKPTESTATAPSAPEPAHPHDGHRYTLQFPIKFDAEFSRPDGIKPRPEDLKEDPGLIYALEAAFARIFYFPREHVIIRQLDSVSESTTDNVPAAQAADGTLNHVDFHLQFMLEVLRDPRQGVVQRRQKPCVAVDGQTATRIPGFMWSHFGNGWNWDRTNWVMLSPQTALFARRSTFPVH